MKQKIIAIVSLLMLIVVLLTGCRNTYGLYFESLYKGDTSLNIIMEVKSNKTDFQVNEIVLDLAFGSERGLSMYYDFDTVGIALYICNSEVLETNPIFYGNYNEEVYDYTIDGAHLVKLIDSDEYNSDYKAKINMGGFVKTNYSHKEALTIPQSVLSTDSDKPHKYICIVVMELLCHKVQKTYRHGLMNCIGIEYEFTDDSTVHLSDPRNMIY